MVIQLNASPLLLNSICTGLKLGKIIVRSIVEKGERPFSACNLYDFCGIGEMSKAQFPKQDLPGTAQQLHSYSQCTAIQFNN